MSETSVQLDEPTRLAMRERAKNDLYFFAKGILGFDWLVPHIHLPICRMLENRDFNRLRFILPRGWLKSTLCTIAYSIWESIRNPDVRILIVQNSHANAKKKLAVIRGKWENAPLLRILFPELVPDKDCTVSHEQVCIKRSGQHAESTFECAGTRTKLVSRHYDIIIQDDTVSPDLDDMSTDALLPSKDDVEQAIGFHRQTMALLTDIQAGRILIVGTRWFEADLLSWNKENEPQYGSVERACRETGGIADEDGEPTWPEKFPLSVLEELRRAMGEYLYSCLYLNKPISASGMVFQPEWFKWYETPPRDVACYTTVDLASDPDNTKGDPDFNVVMTCGKDMRSGHIYVLDYYRARCSASTLVQNLFDHVRRFSPIKVGIESIGYQSQMITWVKERMRAEGLYFMVEPLTHGKRSKLSRIIGLEPFVKSGLLHFKQHQRVLLAELQSISRDRGCLGKNDDVADALSMQLRMWALTRSAEEEKRDRVADNPLSFDAAEEELNGRGDATKPHAWSGLVGSLYSSSPYSNN